jgi:trk system potassium uptake protein TrkH
VTAALRVRAAGRIAVDIPAAFNLVGALIAYLAPAFLFPAAIAIGYGESPLPFLVAGAATGAFGYSLSRLTRGKERVGSREGYLVVALLWLLVPAFGALPYLLAGEEQLASPFDAYFESMSGFTTTGSSILTDIPALPHGLLMWRQFTVWLGGMGIIVLALAVLPRLRVGGRQLFESEAPGPDVEGLTETIRDTARRFLALYLGITVAGILALCLVAWTGLDRLMSPYEAVAHTFTTLGTGGFSTRARSFEEFGAATQWVTVFFMLVAGTNFALMYRALVRRRPALMARDEEFRLYVALFAGASLLLTFELLTEEVAGGAAAVRHGVFQAVSTITTTGYASTDYALWTPFAGVVIVGLMFFGGSAGSTSGSIKIVRHVLIGRILKRELDQTVHPELLAPVRLNRRVVDERTLRAVIVFVLLYVGIFAVGTLVLVADAARTGIELTVFDAVAAAAATLGNAGPGWGFAGPMGSFDPFSDVSKSALTALMFLGRLEIIPAVVLLTRGYWRV